MEKHLASVCARWTGVNTKDGLGPHGSLLTSMPLRAMYFTQTLTLNLLQVPAPVTLGTTETEKGLASLAIGQMEAQQRQCHYYFFLSTPGSFF